jgi:hypothetical protein
MIKLKTIITIIVLFTLLITLQCSLLNNEDVDECNNYKPSDCIEEKPEYGYITVIVTINERNPAVPVTIFEGDVEDNIIVLQNTVKINMKSYRLVNNYYSVKAVYKSVIDGENVTINSIKGDELEFESEEYCDGVCYSEGEVVINVEL